MVVRESLIHDDPSNTVSLNASLLLSFVFLEVKDMSVRPSQHPTHDIRSRTSQFT